MSPGFAALIVRRLLSRPQYELLSGPCLPTNVSMQQRNLLTSRPTRLLRRSLSAKTFPEHTHRQPSSLQRQVKNYVTTVSLINQYRQFALGWCVRETRSGSFFFILLRKRLNLASGIVTKGARRFRNQILKEKLPKSNYNFPGKFRKLRRKINSAGNE